MKHSSINKIITDGMVVIRRQMLDLTFTHQETKTIWWHMRVVTYMGERTLINFIIKRQYETSN